MLLPLMCPSVSGIGCIVRSREGVKGVPRHLSQTPAGRDSSRSSGHSTCTVMCNYITGGVQAPMASLQDTDFADSGKAVMVK